MSPLLQRQWVEAYFFLIDEFLCLSNRYMSPFFSWTLKFPTRVSLCSFIVNESKDLSKLKLDLEDNNDVYIFIQESTMEDSFRIRNPWLVPENLWQCLLSWWYPNSKYLNHHQPLEEPYLPQSSIQMAKPLQAYHHPMEVIHKCKTFNCKLIETCNLVNNVPYQVCNKVWWIMIIGILKTKESTKKRLISSYQILTTTFTSHIIIYLIFSTWHSDNWQLFWCLTQ